MPTTDAGIYRVILEQTFQGKTIFNVFGYLHTLGQDDEQDLCAQAFDEDIVPECALIQTDELTYDTIRAINVTGTLADEVISPATGSGTLSGAEVAGFIGCSFRYNRETKDTRNGAKRFAGILEADMIGVGFEAAYFAKMGVLAGHLSTDISTVGGIFTPIILGKETATPGTWTYNTIVSVQALNRQTSQVSRKVF